MLRHPLQNLRMLGQQVSVPLFRRVLDTRQEQMHVIDHPVGQIEHGRLLFLRILLSKSQQFLLVDDNDFRLLYGLYVELAGVSFMKLSKEHTGFPSKKNCIVTSFPS